MARKRANGEGSISKRANGGWRGDVTYRTPTGEVKRRTVYGKTRADVAAKVKELLALVDAGKPLVQGKATIQEYAERWGRTTLEASARKETTKQTYRTLSRVHIEGGSLREVTLGDLRASEVEEWVLGLRRAGKAQSTVRQAYTVLRAILDAAERDGLVLRNVAALVGRPGVARTEAHALAPGEVDALIAAASGLRHAGLLRFIAETGLRRGEALALRWVDVEAGRIHVRGTLSRVNGELLVTEPKSQRSRRTVPLTPRAREVLGTMRHRAEVESADLGAAWEGLGLVFPSEVGGYVDPRNAARTMETARKRAGLVAGVGLHTLRHSAASAWLSAGMPIVTASRLLGHSSVAITGDFYGHMIPGQDDSLAALMGSAMTAFEKVRDGGGDGGAGVLQVAA